MLMSDENITPTFKKKMFLLCQEQIVFPIANSFWKYSIKLPTELHVTFCVNQGKSVMNNCKQNFGWENFG